MTTGTDDIKEQRTANKMFAQWWGDVEVQSAIFAQSLVTWDSEAFQSPTTAQTQTLAVIVPGTIWSSNG